MPLPVVDQLEAIAATVRACTRCPLSATRIQAVPGEGDPAAEVLFLGEGPGGQEDKEGRPFVGAAGKVLAEMLEKIGLAREQVFITNVVKCRPPDNRDPLPLEKEACRPYLDEQLALIQPKLIVLLGRHALESMIPGQSISKVHGQAKRFKGQVFFPVFHPAATLYRRELKQELERDFLKIPLLLKKLRDEPAPTPPPEQAPLV